MVNASLANQVEQLTAIINAVPTAVIVVAPGGTMTLVNHQAQQLFGYGSEELLGQSVDMLLPQRYRQAHPALRDSFQTQPSARPMGAGRDLFGLRKDGTEFPVEIGLTPLETEEGTLVVSSINDISERKRLERRFRATIESAPTAMVMIDAQGTMVLINKELERLFGYQRDELLHHKVEMLLPPRYQAEHPSLRSGFFAAPQARRMGVGRDLFAQHKDGEEFPVEIGLSPVQTDEGTFVLAAIVDITERKQIQDAVKESEENFRLMVEGIQDYALFMLDPKGRVASWNSGAHRLKGYDEAEILGRHFSCFYTPEDIQAGKPQKELEIAKTQGRCEEESWRIRKDGSRFWANVIISALRDKQGKLRGFAKVTRDFTERKRLESLFRATVESAPIAMVMIGGDGAIQLVNAETERLFGYQRAELLDKPIEQLLPERYRPGHPAMRTGFFATPQARRMGGGRDLFALRKDGSEFPVEIGLNPVSTEAGTLVLAAIVDLTERKRTADATLQQLNDELGRSNVELQRFAYVASHDLQTPLRNVASFVELLNATYGQLLDDQGKDWIRRITQSVKQQQLLVKDLLEFSRVNAQSHPFERLPARQLVDIAVTLLESSLRESHAEIQCGELPDVTGDRSQLVQLLANLIGNAIKYRSDAPPLVQISASHQDGEWCFAIKDNGIGMEQRYLERIFEIFERLHDQRAYPGSGIGLAICRRVIQRHGGRIWVESSPGQGSTFYFTLPEQPEDKA
ncbi:PAS domain S-box protein [Gallaecimonas kandeliae]|uniref:PAS domain S-box protein n=1 Tax=Gallaecimonas kandeliae TaxID=3029055 RepID=UPI00264776F2|nr:PAS domain S-box protein [Gallaecimonas kandeliae]WKE64730.1 PAS domain S-box protein [Gallaecimonas kandeliae]